MNNVLTVIALLLLSIVSLPGYGSSEEAIINADQHPGEWLSHGRTYDEKRYSPLAEIDQKNVSNLGLSWQYATGNKRGMEATPIVADGVMYITTAWSRVVALDASSGKLLWTYDPKVAGKKGRDACCDVVNRGLAIWGDKLYLGALDGRLIALNKKDGSVNWSQQTTDTSKAYTITGAPRVIKGKVIIGNGGAEFGVRGYFSAYDSQTGKMLWRFYTVPTQTKSLAEPAHLQVARKTWSKDSLWEAGLGGTVWDSFAYDPELNLLYVGVGNSAQYNRAQRSPGGGDNLYLSSILAVNPDDGTLVWHYQTTPAESWDYTATQHMILADIDIQGSLRKVIMQAPKNGFFYVLDRASGELISAEKYVHVNWASHVDMKTGRPIETGIGDWSSSVRMISPAIVGGHNWQPMSYSDNTGLVYIPTIHTVYPFAPDPNYSYNPATMNTGENFPALQAAAPDVQVSFCSPTRLTAWDPKTQTQKWQVPFSRGISAGVLSTAGGLVFQGTTDGELKVYSDHDGSELASIPVNVGIMAPPISYQIDGEQYIAVLAGLGGSQGGHADVFDNVNSGHVFAFKLGGNLTPDAIAPRTLEVQINDSALDPGAVSAGSHLYAIHCLRCHGLQAKSSGLYPDLRFSSSQVHDSWQGIVIGGALKANGMDSFGESLTSSDVKAIHSYVISEALKAESFSQRIKQAAVNLLCIPSHWVAE